MFVAFLPFGAVLADGMGADGAERGIGCGAGIDASMAWRGGNNNVRQAEWKLAPTVSEGGAWGGGEQGERPHGNFASIHGCLTAN